MATINESLKAITETNVEKTCPALMSMKSKWEAKMMEERSKQKEELASLEKLRNVGRSLCHQVMKYDNDNGVPSKDLDATVM